MNHDEVVGDLGALAGFIHDEVTEQSDQVSFEQAVELMDAVKAVERSCREAMSLLESELMRQLEGGARQVGTRVFARVDKYKDRVDHPTIERAVVQHAVSAATDRETGEIDPRTAAVEAVRGMHDLYLAPATKVKTSKLKNYDVAFGVIQKVADGTKMEVVETKPDHG